MLRYKVWLLIVSVVSVLALSNCSDSNNSSSSSPANTRIFSVSLNPMQVINGGAATGSATAALTLDLTDNTLTGTVTLTGITGDTVTLNLGFAGEVGTVLFNLQEDSATQWSIPATSILTANVLETLDKGGLYLKVSKAIDGALRGQILSGNIKLIFTDLSGNQEIPPVTATGSAKGAITLDPDTGNIIVHLNASGITGAISSHVHQGLAGVNGPIVFGLSQDPDNVDHWLSTGETLDSSQLANLNKGIFYLNLHTTVNPGGEVRGQIKPDGIEIFFTALSGADSVPPVVTANSGIAATTIQTSSKIVDIHVNLQGLDDATGVTVNQAPLGQNGPEVFALTQDGSSQSHWSLENLTPSAGQYTALRNQGLYLNVASPLEPAGEIRGQLEPDMSTPIGGASFVVSAVIPANGATVAAPPASIDITFNRTLLQSTVSSDRVELLASGGDGSFSDGNEVTVSVAGVSSNGAVLSIDLSGAANTEDVYQLTLDGSSTTPLTDSAGVVLDGDGDDNAGGDFITTFTVSIPPTIVTLATLQTEIFTPSCAVSGCHAGASPQQGMNLSAGQTFSNIVGVKSNESPGLNRVEPGDPDNSYLVHKVEGTASVGGRMPLGGAALSNEKIQKLRQWITDGAKDD